LQRPAYEGEPVAELNFKEPYKRALAILEHLEYADTVIWYAYRFSRYFIKNLDYCEDILHEILLELSKINWWEVTQKDVSRISRNTLARFVARNVMTLSGYTNFRSYLHRKTFLRVDKNDTEVKTEYDMAVKEIEKIWNGVIDIPQPILIIQDKYPIVSEYAESGLSMVNFFIKKKMTKYRLCELIRQAREEYISLLYVDSYIRQ